MALQEDLRQLLVVQEIDGRILRAKSELAALDSGAATARLYQETKTEAERLRALATTAQANQKDAEMKLETIETKTGQVQKKYYSGTVSATRELENLQHEIEMLSRQKGTAEDAVLGAMDEATEAVAAAQAKEAELAALATAYKKIRNTYKERTEELEATIAAETAQRAAAIASLPAPLLSRYDQIRSRRDGIGAASLEGESSCGACHIKVNAQLVTDVRAAQSPQVCEHCGRILVFVPA